MQWFSDRLSTGIAKDSDIDKGQAVNGFPQLPFVTYTTQDDQNPGYLVTPVADMVSELKGH